MGSTMGMKATMDLKHGHFGNMAKEHFIVS